MLDRRFTFAFLTLLASATPGCVIEQQESLGPAGEPTTTQDDALSPNDEMRYRWTRFVRATVQPRLVSLGVSDTYIKRAMWFGLSEGITTIAGNGAYGQKGGAQSAIGFSNCGDDAGINKSTALPDCFGASGYAFKSGNWQVGVAGVQVSDYYQLIPQLYHNLYGDLPPRAIGQSVMRWIGEDPSAFPQLSIEELACVNDATSACKVKRSRWISVLLRDPALNIYVQTNNAWIRDTGRDLGFGKTIVDAVWSEAAQTRSSIAFPETGQTIQGLIAAHWQKGNGAWDCWAKNQAICIATWGLPIEAEEKLDAPIPGSKGVTRSQQRFERALLQVNQYPDAGTLVQGALLGDEITGQAGNPSMAVDDAFAAYYKRYGGVPVFGFAISPAKVEGGRRVQYFERARLEENPTFKPNNDDPVWEVLRGHLGRETE